MPIDSVTGFGLLSRSCLSKGSCRLAVPDKRPLLPPPTSAGRGVDQHGVGRRRPFRSILHLPLEFGCVLDQDHLVVVRRRRRLADEVRVANGAVAAGACRRAWWRDSGPLPSRWVDDAVAEQEQAVAAVQDRLDRLAVCLQRVVVEVAAGGDGRRARGGGAGEERRRRLRRAQAEEDAP